MHNISKKLHVGKAKSDASGGASKELPAIEPDRLQNLWHSDKTPQWNRAVETWRADSPKDYADLNQMANTLVTSQDDSVDRLFAFDESSSKRIQAKSKRWLPAFTAVRGIATSISAIDPYKIAPIVCASVFFGIDVLFNNMNPEDKDKIQDILFDCGNVISECILFETNFPQRAHPSIQTEMKALEDDLPDQYLRALRLAYDIRSSCGDVQSSFKSSKEGWTKWVTARGRNAWVRLTSKIVDWERQAKEIGRHNTTWLRKKKGLEEKLTADEHVVKILEWIKKDDDPEPKLDFIKRAAMPGAGQWFLDSSEFTDWCKLFQPIASQTAPRRVIWLKGGYGTGKTTLLRRVYSALKEFPRMSLQDEILQVVPYFCDASNTSLGRPNYETIVRSMASRLSLSPDFTISSTAEHLYSRLTSTRGQDEVVSTEVWEQLIRDLLEEAPDHFRFAFLVDALDECDLTEAEELLNFMSEILTTYPNVQFLCSSHHQVRVTLYFDAEDLEELEITPKATSNDMKRFIVTNLKERRKGAGDSIFYNPNHVDLFDELEETLVENAHGMFRWVEVWLAILLPLRDDLNTVRRLQDAKDLLRSLRDDVTYKHEAYQLLESGYQRLWDMNDRRAFQDIRASLFHIVLSAFTAQTPSSLTDALRIRQDGVDDDLTVQEVERLYSNFLEEGGDKRLRFVHDSAKKFILNMTVEGTAATEDGGGKLFSERSNHLCIARLYIEVTKQASHPFWQCLKLGPLNWESMSANASHFQRLSDGLEASLSHHNPSSFYPYLLFCGLKHCAYAAERRSISDKLWTEVIDEVVLRPDSAFPLIMVICKKIAQPYGKDFLPKTTARKSSLSQSSWGFQVAWTRSVLRGHDSSLEVLYPHVLALLDIIDEDALDQFQLAGSPTQGSVENVEDNRQRLLFKDAYTPGGVFSWPPFLTDGAERTALQIAARNGNVAAVKTMLWATRFLPSGSSAGSIVSSKEFWDPFYTALKRSDFPVAEALLTFDKQTRATTPKGHKSGPTVGPCTLWTLKAEKDYRPSLHLAIWKLEENEVCRLLAISAPCKDCVNVRDDGGNAAVHMAAKYGYHQLARDLEAKYQADVEARNTEGQNPAEYAASHHAGEEDEEERKKIKARNEIIAKMMHIMVTASLDMEINKRRKEESEQKKLTNGNDNDDDNNQPS